MSRRRAVLSLTVTTLVLAATALASCGRDESAEKKPTPDSPIASESGWLAYQTGQVGFMTDEIHLVRVDGSNDHVIASNLPGRQGHPDFSRDGSRLVFDQLTSEESADQIYVAKADGSAPKRVAHCKLPRCVSHGDPAWSPVPGGSYIAISTAAGPLGETGPARFGIAIVNVNSEEVTPVVDHASTEGQDHFARWSPDGKKLVFWRGRAKSDGTSQTAVFIVNTDGSGLRQLTPWNMLAGDPDWSPQGDLIVFSTRPLFDFPDSGRSELYTMRPDGSDMRKLTSYGEDGPRATQPRWTPDGKAILYTRVTQEGFPRHIWVIDRTGETDAPVLTKESIYTHPVLQPGSR